jgi:mRNA interferase MazF
MVIAQGDIWWADIPAPRGSEPGYRRPVIVVQGDHLNVSNLATVVCVPLTSNLKWATAPGNIRLGKSQTGLPKDSVANASAIASLDKGILSERVGRLSNAKLKLIL